MNLYEKNGNILYILNVLKKYSDFEHKLSTKEIQKYIKEDYKEDIDPRTIRRNINLLIQKFGYDIETYNDNKEGYYISKDPDTDFEPGEIRAIIDTFSYSNYIVPSVAKGIIKKCKNMQNIYENKKLANYQIYSNDTKTDNSEVIKNIEDISQAIESKKKIQFEYWKYVLDEKLEKRKVNTSIVSPYALVYDKQQFYLIAIKEGENKFFHYRLDRIKNITILNEKITIKKSAKEIKDFAESTVEVFGGEKEEIVAICKDWLLENVIDVFGKDAKITRLAGTSDQFNLRVNANVLGFKMWAMRNIDIVEVVEPKSLREELKNISESAYKKYC